ncbi:MAG: T9SS type A sorting domain-containing protein [Chloroherpetonaceae bacterium]
MKKIILALFLIFSSFQSSYSFWDWEEIMSGIDTNHTEGDIISFSAFAAKDNYLFVGTYKYGLYVSTNNGDNWIKTGFPSGLDITSFLVNDDYIFAGTSKGIYSSNDYGNNWKLTGLPESYVTSLALDSNKNIYAGTLRLNAEHDGRVHISTDNGSTWKQGGEITDLASVWALAISGNNLYATTLSHSLFLSTDKGETWESRRITKINGQPDFIPSIFQNVFSLATTGDSLFAGTYSGVYLTTDSGLTWDVRNGNYYYQVNYIAFSGKSIFIGTRDGIWLSNNYGITWKEVSSANWTTQSILIKGDYVFSGCAQAAYTSPGIVSSLGKIYRCKLSDFFLDVKEKGLTSGNSLLYPNPTRDFINTAVYLGWQYQIYDLLGSCVQSGLIDSENINVANLPTGFYTIRFIKEGKQVIEKIMIQ